LKNSEVNESSFIFSLSEWLRNSEMFINPKKWHEEFKRELAKDPAPDRIRVQIDSHLKSKLFDLGLLDKEINELMSITPEAIEIIEESDGGFLGWARRRRAGSPF